MATTGSYVTYSLGNSSYPLTLDVEQGKKPKTPEGLLASTAVQTIDGWIGQIIVDKSIVWESKFFTNVDDAMEAANQRIVKQLGRIFRSDPSAASSVGGTNA
jgi:hypothetical protein